MGSISTVCDEHQHKYFQHSHLQVPYYLNKKSLREIDIPPRKLLSRRSAAMSDVFSDSPKAEDALSKFLPCNNVDDHDDSDPYSSDQFRIYEFKVRKCTRSRSHDWTDCPFAHPGEKARRRDPRRFHYSGTVCSEFRKGYCNKGDSCEFSHGVFECWLHPSRYRTEACKDGKNCKRKVCFFAHSTKQLRMSPDPSSPPPILSEKVLYRNLNHCCVLCHSSPTSPLMSMSHLSPPLSPPLSPLANTPEFSRLSNMESCGFPELSSGGITYKDAVTELMCSMESMRVNEAPASHSATTLMNTATRRNLPWLDVNNFNVEVEQPQFVLSPSTPSPGTSKFFTGESKFFTGNFSGRNLMEDYTRYHNESNLGGPDLGWVNDLLT